MVDGEVGLCPVCLRETGFSFRLVVFRKVQWENTTVLVFDEEKDVCRLCAGELKTKSIDGWKYNPSLDRVIMVFPTGMMLPEVFKTVKVLE